MTEYVKFCQDWIVLIFAPLALEAPGLYHVSSHPSGVSKLETQNSPIDACRIHVLEGNPQIGFPLAVE